MKTILDIKPMQGLGELKFGVSREDVKAVLGEPDETETIDVEGEIHEVEVWSYFDQGHSIYFEKDLDNVCTNFETENEDALLFGKKVFELDKDAIIALMKENNFNQFEIEDDAELDEIIVFFDEAHMQFVFENDQLGLVSWAVAMGDDDEILWP
jgi:hypothetical protein